MSFIHPVSFTALYSHVHPLLLSSFYLAGKHLAVVLIGIANEVTTGTGRKTEAHLITIPIEVSTVNVIMIESVREIIDEIAAEVGIENGRQSIEAVVAAETDIQSAIALVLQRPGAVAVAVAAVAAAVAVAAAKEEVIKDMIHHASIPIPAIDIVMMNVARVAAVVAAVAAVATEIVNTQTGIVIPTTKTAIEGVTAMIGDVTMVMVGGIMIEAKAETMIAEGNNRLHPPPHPPLPLPRHPPPPQPRWRRKGWT